MSRHTDTLATFTTTVTQSTCLTAGPAPLQCYPLASRDGCHPSRTSAGSTTRSRARRSHRNALHHRCSSPNFPHLSRFQALPPARPHGLVYSCEAAALRSSPLGALASDPLSASPVTLSASLPSSRLPWHHIHKPKRPADVSAGRPTSTRLLRVPVRSVAFRPPSPHCSPSPR